MRRAATGRQCADVIMRHALRAAADRPRSCWALATVIIPASCRDWAGDQRSECPPRPCVLGEQDRTKKGLRLGRDIPQDGDDWPDVAFVEADLARLWARWARAIEELGGAVPANQLRALLIIDDSGVLPASRLAAALGTSLFGARRLCDRMTASGLLRHELAAGTSREITLAATAAGHRLAGG
jgi:hypothetical protein